MVHENDVRGYRLKDLIRLAVQDFFQVRRIIFGPPTLVADPHHVFHVGLGEG